MGTGKMNHKSQDQEPEGVPNKASAFGETVKCWYGNLAFRRKVWFSFLTVSLIPVIILGTFSYFQTRRLLIQREQEVVSETLKQSALTLNATLERHRNMMENLVWDSMIRQALEKEYKNNYEMYLIYRDVIDPIFLRLKSLNPQVRRISIYSSNSTLHPHGSNLMPLERVEGLPEGIEDCRIHWRTGADQDLNLYCKIYTTRNTCRNVVNIQVDSEQVFGYLTELFAENYGVLVTDSKGGTVFGCSMFQDSYVNDRLTAEEILEGFRELDRYVLKEETIPATGWRIWLYRPVAVVSAAAWSITGLVCVVVLVCVAVILVSSYALTASVVQPLKELVRNMDRIQEGHLSVDIQGDDRDEIGRLISRFGEMVHRLDCMVNEVYKSKIARQQYELRALQAQINPHFLYNSLSLINWKAIMAGQEEIGEMSRLLSTFYRTTLNKGKNVTLVRGEWDNTCSYARIQNMLHSGRLVLRMELEEGMEGYEILNLLLQPLVENAIVHGLDHKTSDGEKILEVTGRQEGDELVFQVRDNGCGIAQEALADILTAESRGYGVQNVHHRIQLSYGTGYGLSFASKVGEGTQVTMNIPRRMPGEHPGEKAPDADSAKVREPQGSS